MSKSERERLADWMDKQGQSWVGTIMDDEYSNKYFRAAQLLREGGNESAKKPTEKYVISCADGAIRWADEAKRRPPTIKQKRLYGDVTIPGMLERMAFAGIINEYLTAHPSEAPRLSKTPRPRTAVNTKGKGK